VSYQWTAAHENLAGGQTKAQDVFDAWIANPGQRNNMLDLQMKDGGIGRAFTFKTTNTFHSY